MKQYFKLSGDYEGLKVRRLRQSGRLWLVRVINDGAPYWFVMIRNFQLERDRMSGARTMGVWRFVKEEDAEAKYGELVKFYPPHVVSEKQKAAREAIRARGALLKGRRISGEAVLEGQDSGQHNEEEIHAGNFTKTG